MGRRVGAALLALGLLAAAPASGATRRVCGPGHLRGCFARIQTAVDAARPGDTVRVPAGTYPESVVIRTRGLRLIGDPRVPARVVLQGGGRRATAVLVRGAAGVTVQGFAARRYRVSGFVARSAPGYVFRNLVAARTGRFGVYAYAAPGGLVRDSAASENSVSGFAVHRSLPLTVLRGVSAFLNPTGLRAANVHVSGSDLFDNGVGIVADPGRSEITDNDVFWNNFDYVRGAPFPIRDEGLPLGTGILVRRGGEVVVSGNRIFGQFLYGAAGAADLSGNAYGFNALAEEPAEDRNGADVAGPDQLAATADDPEASWVRHEHPEIEGFDPVERWPR